MNDLNVDRKEEDSKEYKYDEKNTIKLPTNDSCHTIINYIINHIFKHPDCKASADKFEITLRSSGKTKPWMDLKTKFSDVYEYVARQVEHHDEEPADNSPTGKNLKHPHNTIWAGAPGTGKSFQLNQDASKDFMTGNIMRVTFHPEYTYYDFVGTYRPKMSKNEMGKIEYCFVPGPFAKMLKRALWNKGTNYCLIIEEINRANMAAAFGDVFQLLDRTSEDSVDGSVKMHESEYAICPSEELYAYLMEEPKEEPKGNQPNDNIKSALRLPANLYIWATMNSADQGVFPMDTAFKRRWSFVNMDIDPSQESIDDWDKIRRGINDMLLTHHVQEDKLMGYYFLKEKERAALATALKEKVMLYLFEDAAKPFRKNVFKASMNTCAKLRQGLDKNAPDLGVFQSEVWDGNPKSKDELPNTGVSIAGEHANEAQS